MPDDASTLRLRLLTFLDLLREREQDALATAALRRRTGDEWGCFAASKKRRALFTVIRDLEALLLDETEPVATDVRDQEIAGLRRKVEAHEDFLASLHQEALSAARYHQPGGMKPTCAPVFSLGAAAHVEQSIRHYLDSVDWIVSQREEERNRAEILELQRSYWKAKAEGDEKKAGKMLGCLNNRGEEP